MRNLQEFVENPDNLDPKDRIAQIYNNERYDFFVLMASGRVFKKRAKGTGGSYDYWQEIDLLAEIKDDLKIQ